MDLGLGNRVVVVTGSSQGIGKAAALLFAKEGARVAVTYRREREKALAVVDEIARAGGEAIALPFDLASSDSIRRAMQGVVERWGGIDVLVNNAVAWGNRGPWEAPRFEDFPEAEWTALLRANAEGHYTAIQAALPSMRAKGWGRIVNVSSGLVLDGLPGSGPYVAAKATMHGLNRTLMKELGPAGVLVNVVMPGATLTEHMLERIPPALREQLASTSPIRRLLPPEEVVPTIVFLGSAANTAVTGEVIRASGGIA